MGYRSFEENTTMIPKHDVRSDGNVCMGVNGGMVSV